MPRGLRIGTKVRTKRTEHYSAMEATVVGKKLVLLSRSPDGRHRLFGFHYSLRAGTDIKHGYIAEDFEVTPSSQRR